MQFRALLVASALLAASQSYAADGDNCVPASFNAGCDADNFTFRFCKTKDQNGTALAQPVESSINCQTALNDAATDPPNTNVGCAAAPCTGPGCTEIGGFCIGLAAGAPCIGESVLYTQDANDDNLANLVPCAAGFSCTTTVVSNALVDTCAAAPLTCSAPGGQCVGEKAVNCTGGSVDTNNDGTGDASALLTDPSVVDCATLTGSVCTVDSSQGTSVAYCGDPNAGGEGEGEGAATGGEGEGEATTCPCGDAPPCDDASTCDDSNTSSSVCSNAGPSMPMFAGLALVLLGLARRRRA